MAGSPHRKPDSLPLSAQGSAPVIGDQAAHVSLSGMLGGFMKFLEGLMTNIFRPAQADVFNAVHQNRFGDAFVAGMQQGPNQEQKSALADKPRGELSTIFAPAAEGLRLSGGPKDPAYTPEPAAPGPGFGGMAA